MIPSYCHRNHSQVGEGNFNSDIKSAKTQICRQCYGSTLEKVIILNGLEQNSQR